MTEHLRRLLTLAGLLAVHGLAVPASARADVILLLGQPYGRFGAFSPTGHVSVYLPRACAEHYTRLRLCTAGEAGVVVSRYHRVAGRDWLAMPLVPYLYAVDDAADVPVTADAARVLELRDAYRRAHFADLVPDRPGGGVPRGDWVQLVGAAYDREIVALGLSTTEAQDRDLVAWLNARENTQRFHLLWRNCADFARDLVNVLYPGALRDRFVADLGITTPKALGRSLVEYARGLDGGLVGFVVRQVPGSRKPSGKATGVLEALVRSKKYVVPLALVQPVVPAGLAVGYLARGRFDPYRYAKDVVLTPSHLAATGTAGRTGP